MKSREILPLALAAVILVPATAELLRKPPPPPPVEEVRPPEPTPRPRPSFPQDWFSSVRPRCTPSDFRLVTDLNPPLPGVEGTGYKAACYALARQIPSARALLLSLPEEDRVQGASKVYEVGQGLAGAERHDAAGPLLELVLEFWPNHSMALYQAGTARFVTGDAEGAQDLLGRFLEVYTTEDGLTANARRMMGGLAER